MTYLPTDNLLQKFSTLIRSSEWGKLESMFLTAQTVYIIGNGGNLAVAQHAASDMCRLTDKTAIAPSNAPFALSLVADYGYGDWLVKWLEAKVRALSMADRKGCLLLALSASGRSTNIFRALDKSAQIGVPAGLISGSHPEYSEQDIPRVVLRANYFHSAEALTMLLMYQLITSAGFTCPSISQAISSKAREPSFAGTPFVEPDHK